MPENENKRENINKNDSGSAHTKSIGILKLT